MKKLFFAFIIIVATNIIAQSNSGGLANLKLGVNAKTLAMGDLGVASANGAAAFYYNPALLGSSSNILFSHNSYIQDVSNDFLAASFSVFGLPLAAGFSTTTIPNIEVRTKPGEPDGKFDAHYFYAGFSSAFHLYDKLRGGFTIKYLYEGLFSDDATGYAMDFGLAYSDFMIENLSLGTVLKNIGSMRQLRNKSTQLPTDFRLGANYFFSLNNIDAEISLNGGVQKYLREDEIHLHAGAEIFYANTVAFRIGYITGYEAKNISLGLGLKWGSIFFDYSFVPYSFDLGNSQFVTLAYHFN